jgi:hypothetical protein
VFPLSRSNICAALTNMFAHKRAYHLLSHLHLVVHAQSVLLAAITCTITYCYCNNSKKIVLNYALTTAHRPLRHYYLLSRLLLLATSTCCNCSVAISLCSDECALLVNTANVAIEYAACFTCYSSNTT